MYERVNKKSPTAWKTLQYFSLVDPEAIPYILVLELLKIDKFKLEDVKIILKNNSIIEVINKLGVNCFNIHRRTQEMVQRIIKTRKESELLEKKINEVVLNEFGMNSEDYDKNQWNYSKLLLTHILRIEKNKYLSKEQLTSIWSKLGNYYNCVIGDFNQALEYDEKSLEILKVIQGQNENRLDKAASLNNVGMTYKRLGKFQKSLDYQLQSLEMFKVIYGQNENHPDIALSLNNIGETYNNLGQFQKGLEYHLQGLEMRKVIYGQNGNHPEIALSLNYVAMTYFRWGKAKKGEFLELQLLKKAIEFQFECISMFEEVFLDKNHPHLSTCHFNFGLIHSEIGDFRNALKYFLKSIIMKLELEGKL